MSKTLQKRIPDTSYELTYTAFKEKLLTPITKEDIGKKVYLADRPLSVRATLIEVRQVGEKGWPHGGYVVQEPGLDYVRNCFLDEVMLVPEKPKRVPRTKVTKKPKKVKSTTTPRQQSTGTATSSQPTKTAVLVKATKLLDPTPAKKTGRGRPKGSKDNKQRTRRTKEEINAAI